MENESQTAGMKDETGLKEDNQMLMVTHLSQLLNLVTGLGGIIVPILLWQMKKDEIKGMDEHGKEIVNFQISLFIYLAVGAILTIIVIGLFVLIAVGIIAVLFPILQALKARDGKPTKYPLTIRFIK